MKHSEPLVTIRPAVEYGTWSHLVLVMGGAQGKRRNRKRRNQGAGANHNVDNAPARVSKVPQKRDLSDQWLRTEGLRCWKVMPDRSWHGNCEFVGIFAVFVFVLVLLVETPRAFSGRDSRKQTCHVQSGGLL